MTLFFGSCLFKIKLLGAKKINYKTQDNNQSNYKSKSSFKTQDNNQSNYKSKSL